MKILFQFSFWRENFSPSSANFFYNDNLGNLSWSLKVLRLWKSFIESVKTILPSNKRASNSGSGKLNSILRSRGSQSSAKRGEWRKKKLEKLNFLIFQVRSWDTTACNSSLNRLSFHPTRFNLHSSIWTWCCCFAGSVVRFSILIHHRTRRCLFWKHENATQSEGKSFEFCSCFTYIPPEALTAETESKCSRSKKKLRSKKYFRNFFNIFLLLRWRCLAYLLH